MALPPGWNVLTGDPMEVVRHFLNRLNNSIQSRPLREFWSEPYQILTNDHFRTLQFSPKDSAPIYDLDRAMQALYHDATPSIETLCREWQGIKVWPVLYVRYESANPLDEHYKHFDAHLPVSHSIFLYHQPELYTNHTNPYHPGIERLIEKLLAANAKFIRGKSGLMLAEIYSLNLNVVRFAPLAGSAYSPLPKFLQNKKAIVNVQNDDDRCFGFAIASALHPVDHHQHPNRPEKYIQYLEENGPDGLQDIEYPVSPLDIPQLEQRLNISINLFSYFDDHR